MCEVSVKPFNSGQLLTWNENYVPTREDIVFESVTKKLLVSGVVYRLAWSGYSILLQKNGSILELLNKTGKPCDKYVLASEGVKSIPLSDDEAALQFVIP